MAEAVVFTVHIRQSTGALSIMITWILNMEHDEGVLDITLLN